MPDVLKPSVAHRKAQPPQYLYLEFYTLSEFYKMISRMTLRSPLHFDGSFPIQAA